MLLITIPELVDEKYDEENNEFIYTTIAKEETLELEHSLASVSNWESKWCKSFLFTKDKTTEEVLDYIKCMTITPNVDPKIYNRITDDNIRKINEYIDAPMTATTFSDSKRKNKKTNREIITAEVIYYWMVTLNIPFECDKWHLNRLIALVKVCSIKNNPPKKMSQREIMSQNSALNAIRKQQLNTKG